jgi:hypothetical protein
VLVGGREQVARLGPLNRLAERAREGVAGSVRAWQGGLGAARGSVVSWSRTRGWASVDSRTRARRPSCPAAVSATGRRTAAQEGYQMVLTRAKRHFNDPAAHRGPTSGPVLLPRSFNPCLPRRQLTHESEQHQSRRYVDPHGVCFSAGSQRGARVLRGGKGKYGACAHCSDVLGRSGT